MSQSYTTLISAVELEILLQQSADKVVIVETSFDLSDPDAGERHYQRRLLPGAFYAHLDRDLCGKKTGLNGRHPLPEREIFAQTVGRWGITPEVQVIVYDGQDGMYAARLWWMLRWLGHPSVAVLNGGLTAWEEQKGALTREIPQLMTSAPYPDCSALVATMDTEAVLAKLDRVCLVDARAPERFAGTVEPIDPVAGHILGARNRFFKQNLESNGQFKSPEALQAEFLDMLGTHPMDQVVHQCGSGVTACHNLLAMEVAGLSGSQLYPGSWSEWCADPARPTVSSR